MLPYLKTQRCSKIYREFSYKKTLKDSINKKKELHKVIAWDVFYMGSYITTLDTLKEVRHFIDEKANT